LTAKFHSRYVKVSESGVGVGNFEKIGVGVKVGNFGRFGIVVGHFTSDSATLVPLHVSIKLGKTCYLRGLLEVLPLEFYLVS